jgi:hypothetical protein
MKAGEDALSTKHVLRGLGYIGYVYFFYINYKLCVYADSITKMVEKKLLDSHKLCRYQ